MKASLKIGNLYKINNKVQLQAFRADEKQIRWGSSLDKSSFVDRNSVFQYIGKKYVERDIKKRRKAWSYIKHIFVLLSDSKEYIISGYYIRNLEPLK